MTARRFVWRGAGRACLALAACLGCGAAIAAAAATPAVDLARADVGLYGARVPPNLLLNLSLTHAAAAAAHGGDYAPQRDYAGYFHARMCYSYPYRSKDGVMLPDLRVATAYFSVSKRADALHGCGGDSFSGNFLNWASASMLDIVRYALTGGERVIDEVRKTVLQRAYLPDGGGGPDFFSHPVYFPRKVLHEGVAAATPFSLAQLAIVSCRNRLLFGDGSLPLDASCEAPGAAGKHGVFLARVRVCDADEGPVRADLCMAYGKNYKPVGAIQRHDGRVRVGVFGHLNAAPSSAGPVYGGVLRAPLAHVGRQRWLAPDFLPQDNADAEWYAANGMYAEHGGGVTAYINGLGRSHAERPGAYAAVAPLAELLYESLRYLQGRQASAVLPAAMPPPAVDDGWPVVSPWSDPQLASCQRHVVVTVGDAGMAGDRYVPGNVPVHTGSAGGADIARAADTFSSPALDAMAWTRAVGKLESEGGQGNPAPQPELAGLEALADGAGGASYHAAGLAYWSHVKALRPGGKAGGAVAATFEPLLQHYAGDLRPGDPAAAPLSTPLLLAAKYGGFADTNGDANPYKSGTGDANAEWRGGRWPEHYLPGSDPAALIAGLRAAFVAADKGTGVAALAGPSLMALAGGAEEAYWFQTQLRLADGGMSVSRSAFALGSDGALAAGKTLWRTGERNDAGPGDAPAALRPVYTLDGQGALTPLAWKQLDAEQRALFDGGSGGQGEQRLDYVLGNRSHEVGQPGGFLRRRSGSLGAAPHGNLVHVGAPGLGMSGPGYGVHRQMLLQRRKMLYLGANDGLLHAFDARTGKEWFAYLPQALLGAAAATASTHYSPGPVLDGAAATAEVLALGRWKTVLASGMGGGAQGVFALDITDPARFAQDGALWEFTDRDDKLIGNVRGPPGFARINMGGKEGALAYRDFVVVGSGYNNHVDDGKETTAPASSAAVFLLALDRPPDTPWLLGSNYFRLKVPVAGGGDAGHDAGADAAAVAVSHALGPPALVPGEDGALAVLYAGDLQGNIWRFRMAGGPPWNDGVVRKLVFVARDAQGRRQPVTQQIKVAHAPGGGYLLLFGTGKLVEAADAWPGAFLSQALYAVHDDLQEQSATRSRADLEPRHLAEAPGGMSVDGAALRYTGDDARHGWYVDFIHAAQTGERSVHSPVLAGGKVLFNTVLPGRDACARPATRLYALDVLSGFAADGAGLVQPGAVTGSVFDGLARAPPLVLEVGSSVGAVTAAGRAEGRKQLAVLQPGLPGTVNETSGVINAVKVVSAALPARRISWREVANWRELHEAAEKKVP
ncbi:MULTISPECIES: pilus assembly protein [unclassified Janthinobacterium]|uniref:pilus assembly protein n=1 Tax=unclassified Janthinobacterium TaxID=2610881 RepID=UPI0008804544|nr:MULTISPECIES: PilC/PilY family type IV pilus protein [unclassified Janthinobacterium]SDA76115.1 type IV pilus assembly protein PilY1 [Janthinobacterium sp. 551a]SFB61400.1 type IV pilus assembly protein PilY1 [Janthinobacterium sp. 344]